MGLTVGKLNADTIGDTIGDPIAEMDGSGVADSGEMDGSGTADSGEMDGSGTADARVRVVVLVDETVAVTVVSVGVTIGCGDNVGVKGPEVVIELVTFATGTTPVVPPFIPPGLQLGGPPIEEINCSSAYRSKAASAPAGLKNNRAVGNS